MLSRAEAAELVLREIDKLGGGRVPVSLVESYTIEKPYGWAFFYNSKAFLETGNYGERLIGNGPVLVNKYTGEIAHCGTHAEPSKLIREREEKLGW